MEEVLQSHDTNMEVRKRTGQKETRDSQLVFDVLPSNVLLVCLRVPTRPSVHHCRVCVFVHVVYRVCVCWDSVHTVKDDCLP